MNATPHRKNIRAKISFASALAAAALTALTSHATVRYVDYTNGADAGDATAAPGWKTLAYAVANADAGDEIVLAKGTHFCKDNLVLDKALHIHGAGEPGETLFDAEHKVTSTSAPHVKITADGVLVNNLTFYRLCGGNYHNKGLFVVSGNSVVSNCVFTGCGLGAGGDNRLILDMANGVLTSCWITNNVCRQFPMVQIEGANATRCENCVIAENTVATANANGGCGLFNVRTGLSVVRNCTVANNCVNGNYCALGVHYQSGAAMADTHCKIYNTISWGNTNTVGDARNVYFRRWYVSNFVYNDTTTMRGDDNVDYAPNYKPNSWTYCGKECMTIDPAFGDGYALGAAAGNTLKGGAKTGTDGAGVSYCTEVDIYGKPRGATPSMGAIQYVASAEMIVNVFASKTEARLPETITLRCEVEGAQGDVSYAWDFNDDGTVDSTEAEPVLGVVGTYTAVKVTVTDDATSKSAYFDGTLTILPKFLDVTVSADQTAVRAPGVITLSAATTNEVTAPLSYSWDLNGDGIEDSTEANPVLSAVGTYVNPTLLKLSDADGKYSDKVVLKGKFIIGPAAAQTITVNPGDSLADALGAAFDGDEIILKKGTHSVTSVLTVERPITVRGEGEKEETILDANYGNNNAAFWHFDITASGAKVCNLTFTRFGHRYDSGYIRMSGDSIISNVVVTSCGWDGNSGTMVQLSAGLLTHSWLTNNIAGYCAGVNMDGNSTMENCAILNNRSTGSYEQGAVLRMYTGSGVRTVRNCTIAGNTFAHTNNAAIYGYCWDAAKESVRLYNNIVWGNTCTKEVAVHPNAYNAATQKWFVKNNCWDYDVAAKLQDPEKGTDYGSVLADPQFDADKGGAPWLSSGSPCRDAGSDEYGATSATDILGKYRRMGKAIDIGCLEYVSGGNLFFVR